MSARFVHSFTAWVALDVDGRPLCFGTGSGYSSALEPSFCRTKRQALEFAGAVRAVKVSVTVRGLG